MAVELTTSAAAIDAVDLKSQYLEMAQIWRDLAVHADWQISARAIIDAGNQP
jgi:hypothetical protein